MKRPVSEVMTRDIIVLQEEENLLDVARDMKRHHLRHLPVVGDGKLVGMVSHSDLLRFMTTVLDSTAASGVRDLDTREQTFVSEIMTTPVTSVNQSTPMLDAVRELATTKFGALPVVDDEGTLVGIVSEHDMMKALASMVTGQEQDWDSATP